MHGPDILVRALAVPATPDKYGNEWRYHSRSDRHSKIACWGMLFDVLATSSELRKQVAKGKVAFAINQALHDFEMNRKASLGLVLGTPADSAKAGTTFKGLAAGLGLALTAAEQAQLDGLPDIPQAPVRGVRMAIETKVCMTAHVRALSRLFDELDASHLQVHGAADEAIAIGHVIVNASTSFLSSDRNKRDLSTHHPPIVTPHRQPADAERVIARVSEIARRVHVGEQGFDAVGISVIDFTNDEAPPRMVTRAPAPPPHDPFHYETVIYRVQQLYSSRFGG